MQDCWIKGQVLRVLWNTTCSASCPFKIPCENVCQTTDSSPPRKQACCLESGAPVNRAWLPAGTDTPRRFPCTSHQVSTPGQIHLHFHWDQPLLWRAAQGTRFCNHRAILWKPFSWGFPNHHASWVGELHAVVYPSTSAETEALRRWGVRG